MGKKFILRKFVFALFAATLTLAAAGEMDEWVHVFTKGSVIKEKRI